jgi:four helix bundle protein
MRNDKENVIVDKTIQFSLAIVKYCEALEQGRKFVIAKQLLRCATSIGANVFEAQNGESKAAKEASETLYWLILCERSESYHFDPKLRENLDEITRILSKIISTAKGRIPGFIWVLIYSFSNFQILKLTH